MQITHIGIITESAAVNAFKVSSQVKERNQL
jgi:hypothetical protein